MYFVNKNEVSGYKFLLDANDSRIPRTNWDIFKTLVKSSLLSFQINNFEK